MRGYVFSCANGKDRGVRFPIEFSSISDVLNWYLCLCDGEDRINHVDGGSMSVLLPFLIRDAPA